jgi:hypothetical protein
VVSGRKAKQRSKVEQHLLDSRDEGHVSDSSNGDADESLGADAKPSVDSVDSNEKRNPTDRSETRDASRSCAIVTYTASKRLRDMYAMFLLCIAAATSKELLYHARQRQRVSRQASRQVRQCQAAAATSSQERTTCRGDQREQPRCSGNQVSKQTMMAKSVKTAAGSVHSGTVTNKHPKASGPGSFTIVLSTEIEPTLCYELNLSP